MKIKKTKGFFTLEALIAILVFMVGVLGVLQIQSNSVAAVSDSQYRVNAAYLAESMIGQMWVDRPNIGTYAAGSGTEYDNWLNELKATLPGVADSPPVITAVPSNGGFLVTVQIFWRKPSDEALSRYEAQATIF